MKNKKRIELNKLSEDSPTPSVIRERNGVINPAFLSTPGSAETSPEHHNNHNHNHNYNQQQNHSRDVYNPNNWSNHVNQNGVDSQTSSWVYNFNESYIPESATLPIHSRFKEYGDNRYIKDNHLVYDVDLNDEHQQSSKKSLIKRKCCKTFLHLFVWCVIAVSLLGIAISVAFIVYIEKFAKCTDRSAINVNVPNTITLLANSSSSTTSSVGISEGQNATTDRTTMLGANFTTTLLPHNITVSTLSPFDTTVNQTSASFIALLSKSVIMEVNNHTTPASNLSLINDTSSDYSVDEEESEINHKFLSANASISSANDNSTANLSSIQSLNESKIAGDFNISMSSSNDSTALVNNNVTEYYNASTTTTMKAYNESIVTTVQPITRPNTELVTNDSYRNNNNDNNTARDRLNATTIDTLDISITTSSPLAIMSDTRSVANNTTEWSTTTAVIGVINHTVVANVAFNVSTDFENVFKSSANAINHETVNLTDLSLMISNRTAARVPTTL